MKNIGLYMAKNMQVNYQSTVSSIKPAASSKWSLYDHKKCLGHFDWVITSIPSNQASAILPEYISYYSKLKAIKMSACFTLMLELIDNSLSYDAALVRNSDIDWISMNSSKPNRPQLNSLLAHSTNQYADQNIEEPLNEISQHLLSETKKVTSLPSDSLRMIDIHRWKYANIKKHRPYLMIDSHHQMASCGDWCVEGKVEGAFLSAFNLYQHLQQTWN